MPIFRWKAVDLGLTLALTAVCVSPARGADDPTWFGPACERTPDFPARIPVATRRLLLQVVTEPGIEGPSQTVLQTVDGALWVSAETLRLWRVSAPAQSLNYEGRNWYALAGIDGIHDRYDDCTQTVWLDTAGVPKARRRFALEATPTIEPLRVDPGGYLNLDTQYASFDGEEQFSALTELGIFNHYGYGGSTVLIDQRGSRRLDTSWNYDDAERLLRLTVGDSITRPGDFGQAVRFGGVQWGRAFALSPGLVTFPQPALRGNAALPSTVDVYVNQVLRSRQDVPAGPFELTQVPVSVGQGQVQLVTRDLLGRESVASYPIYASQSLLREGLTDFTVESGWQRRDYSQRSAVYGPFIAAGTWRRGMSNWWTLELHGEQFGGHQGVAASVAAVVPELGTFSAGLAGSYASGRVGDSVLAGFQRIAPAWSLALETRRANSSYRRIGDDSNATRTRDLVSVGLNLFSAGSLSLTAVRQSRLLDGRTDILSTSYSRRLLRDMFLSVNATRSSGAGVVDRQLLLSLSYSFSRNLFANAQVLHDQAAGTQEQFSVQKPMGGVLGYGYQATAGLGQNARRSAQAQWAQELGTLSGGVDESSGMRGYRAGYSTGIAWQGQQAFWTRPIEGNFAVVDTQGVGDVGVYADEHLAGHTDSGGILLLPNLRPYDINRLRIDTADVPIRYDLDHAEQSVRLPSRGATRVTFPVSRTLSLLLRLHLADGAVVPVAASTRYADGSDGLPVGYDGKVFVEDAQRHRSVTVEWSGHRCLAEWTPPQNALTMLNATCREVRR